MRRINLRLSRNRRVVQELMRGGGVVLIDRNELMERGYSFRYQTAVSWAMPGQVLVHHCYEFVCLDLGSDGLVWMRQDQAESRTGSFGA